MKQLALQARTLNLDIHVDIVQIEPVHTFCSRFAAALAGDGAEDGALARECYNMAYVSHCVFKSQQVCWQAVCGGW
jgi:hypothetical protein